MNRVPHSDLTSYYTEREDRRALDMRAVGIPECVVLGHLDYRKAYPPLPRHSHYGVVELAYMASGQQPYEVGGHSFLLAGGEGVVIPPDTPHSSDGLPSYPGQRYWVQFKLPANTGATSWMGLTPPEARPLIEMLGKPTLQHAPWPSDLAPRFDKLFRLAQRPPSVTHTAMIRTAILALLFDLLDLGSGEAALAYRHRIEAAAQWIEEHLADDISVGEMAARANLSETLFARAFKEVLGLTPHHYLRRRRIEKARVLLGEGRMTVTEVAMACGFSSSQYFATTFKRIVGVAPSHLRGGKTLPLPQTTDGQ